MKPIVELCGIGKQFFGVPVLRDIDLELRVGEVHALVGENGAGKSTLMKILAGVHRPDTGELSVDGQVVHLHHPVQAQRHGIATVFQEFNLLPERNVAENLFVGREPRRRGLVDTARMHRETAAVLESLGIESMSTRRAVGTLSVAEQQIIEIAKAVSLDARVISMDEPTAALAGAEVELLYRLVERLAERGVTVLYVTHRLREIFDLSQRVTVLKDGAVVTTTDTTALDTDSLVRLMVGRDLTEQFPARPAPRPDAPARLQVRGAGNASVNGIDLDVHAGEIVGIAGLQGSGRTEIVAGIFGVDQFQRGTVVIDGTPHDAPTPRSSARLGVALVSEDRKSEGLALSQSVLANGRLVLDGAFPESADRRAARVSEILDSMRLVARNHHQEVRFLSGGNQQKVVLAKWLVTDPKVILLDEPTRGIDVGARRSIYELITELAATGVAVLMISSELPELLGMADRIAVIHEGQIAGELPGRGAGTTEADIMALATGARVARDAGARNHPPRSIVSEVPA